MAISANQFTFLCVIGIIFLARPAHAFGAGNIGSTSKIEGENWRHGDLEDTLLTIVASQAMGGKKFSKLDVKRVYFGNWLRDYSQAVDVGTVKNVSAEAIRVVLWILGFMSFGYGTKEFEVTTERLGCYRPEEHIDNPKDYAENEDARQYDRRLRGPVDERRELAIDPVTGLKAYIASENLGIDTSAGLVRKLFGRCIELGRRYARNKNKADLHEALRLLGTACHCLEDFSAHSNYTELALIELGERDVFPHVGRNCKVRLQGARQPVYPIVTGTFGGVDFLHSVTGEFDDKVTQSEIQELEGTLQNAQTQGENTSMLQDLLSKVPEGVFGDKDEAGKADELKQNAAQHQMQNTQISPREPEEWLQYINDAQKQIYPIIEWHDEVMQSITETIEKIPILPNLIENIQEQVNIFVFSLLAPFMLPIIQQIKSELNTGSNTIIQSSVDKQHIVFEDDDCSDPTHSMLSKDHFSNVLNEPAGKIAGHVLKWVVPQLIAAWDDEEVDVDQTLNRIIRGVFHHPALRDDGDDGASEGRREMFGVVEKWWGDLSEREKDRLRDQLSRDGVEQSRNHKAGVHDHGHGSAKKLGMPNAYIADHTGAPGGLGNIGSSGFAGQPMVNKASQQVNQFAGEAAGGGALGNIVGGLAGGLAGAIGTGVALGLQGEKEDEDSSPNYNRSSYGNDGSRTQTSSGQYGRPQSGTYGQRQPGGYSLESQQEERTNYGGGYSSEARRYGSNTTSSYSRQHEETSTYGGGRNTYGQSEISSGYGSQQISSGRRIDDDDDSSSYARQQQSHGRRTDDADEGNLYGHQQQSYGRRNDDDDDDNQRSSYGRRRNDDNNDDNDYERNTYGRRRDDDDGNERSSHGRRGGDDDDDDNRRNTGGGYGGRQQAGSGYGSSGFGGYDRSDDSGRRGGGGYGREETSTYGGGRGNEDEYGGQTGFGSEGGRRARQRGEVGEDDMPGGFAGGDDEDDERRGGYSRRRQQDNY